MAKLMPGYRTPRAVAQGLGAAHGGTHHFLMQRLTALANIPLVLVFIVTSAQLFFGNYDQARVLLLNPWIAGALALFFISVSLHMRLGMQVIIEDYSHTIFNKSVLLIANTFYCALVLFVSLFALLRLNFGL